MVRSQGKGLFTDDARLSITKKISVGKLTFAHAPGGAASEMDWPVMKVAKLACFPANQQRSETGFLPFDSA